MTITNVGEGLPAALSTPEKAPDADHVEKASDRPEELSPEHRDYLLRRHGTLDLKPLPSMDPNEPYNWSESKKNVQLSLVAFHALMTTFTAASIIPAFEPLSISLGVTIPEASYLVSVQIAVLGFAPLFWRPVSRMYGRMPIWLISTLGSCVCNIGCAVSRTYGSQMAARALVAFFIAPPIGIGGAVVVETFLAAQRGQKMGIWTLLVTLGPPGAPFIFGFVAYHVGWTWIYWILAIINAVQFLAYLAIGAETRYVSPAPGQPATVHKRLSLFRRLDPHPMTAREILVPITIGRHLSVLVPAIAYAMVFNLSGVLLTVEIPQTFIPTFGLNPQQLGLQFIGLIIGSIIGEQCAGPLSDYWMKRRTKQLGRTPRPEYRLWLSYFGFLTAIIGLIVFFIQLTNATPMVWNVTPIIGAAIASFGNQLVTTICVTYAIDCFPTESAAVGGFITMIRQTWSFIGPFWFPTMFTNIGYNASAGVTTALIVGCGIIPIAAIQFGRGSHS